ncbi:hypothetical protein GCM10009689_24330 [Brevibacterium antiquum]
MGQILARINRKTVLEVDDAETSILLVRKGQISHSWALNEVAQVRAIVVNKFWSSSYVRFVRQGAPVDDGPKYSSFDDPDAVEIFDNKEFLAASGILKDLARRRGISFDDSLGVGNSDEISVRTKRGKELVVWLNGTIYVKDRSVSYQISDLEAIRLFISNFGISYIQLVPKGEILSWPDGQPVDAFPHTFDLDGFDQSTASLEAMQVFRKTCELRYPELFVDLKKSRNRQAVESDLSRRTAETKGGEPIEIRVVPVAIAFLIYPREIWTGQPFSPSSRGGSLESVRASYSVSGNHLMHTRTTNSVVGTTRIHSQVDMRQFQVNVEGPDFSFTRTWSTEDGATDAKIAAMVNTINEASLKVSRQSQELGDAGPALQEESSKHSATAPQDNSEQFRRLLNLYAKNLISEDEFVAARQDLAREAG